MGPDEPREGVEVVEVGPLESGPPPLLALAGIDKAFAGVAALRDVSLTINRGGVGHALVGTNGSGKSTLMNILSGQLRPDRGTVTVGGEAVTFSTPAAAISGGIVMVSQETAVAPDLTVAENMFLGRRMQRGRLGIDWRATARQAATIMSDLAPEIDVHARVSTLRPDEQQIVEIGRALSMRCKIMILDEPTSSLSEDEVESVSAAIQRVKGLGVSVILVSHRFEEIFALCEEVTVLRDGRTVQTGSLEGQDADSLIATMVGRERVLTETPAPAARGQSTQRVPALTLRGISAPGTLNDVSLEVGEGEIVGIAGLIGSGRSELLAAAFGELEMSGEISVAGTPVSPSPRKLIDRHVGYVPPDRKLQGLVLSQSVAENLSIVRSLTQRRWRSPDRAGQLALAGTLGEQLGLRAASPSMQVGALSGGNQQKIALGKWLAAGVRVLLLDEPTRGVDVEAKAEIHELLRAQAAEGVAMLVSSNESSELLALCDRILVMVRGRIVADLPAAELSADTLATHTGGQL